MNMNKNQIIKAVAEKLAGHLRYCAGRATDKQAHAEARGYLSGFKPDPDSLDHEFMAALHEHLARVLESQMHFESMRAQAFSRNLVASAQEDLEKT